MRGKRDHGQFCPVARAAELVAVRWMPLVLRELLAGGRRFADLRRGIPLISPVMLSQRLKELVDAGAVERVALPGPDGRAEYRLTEAGKELRPVVDALGIWGQRWAQRELRAGEIDPELLMWVSRRRLKVDALPSERAVLLFELPDVPIALRRFWLVVDGGEVDLCLRNPGHAVDLTLVASVVTMTRVYLGQLDPAVAVRAGAIALHGSRALARTFPAWCARSPFAGAARRPVHRTTGRTTPHSQDANASRGGGTARAE